MKSITFSVMYGHQIHILMFHVRSNLERIGKFSTYGFGSLLCAVTQNALVVHFVIHVCCLVAKLGEMLRI